MPKENETTPKPPEVVKAEYLKYKKKMQQEMRVHISQPEWERRLKAGESVVGEKFEME